MARKDFDVYYNQICEQYMQLQNVLKDLSEEVSNGVVEPERIEQLKQTIIPVENNYRTLGYIKYILDKPTRKHKQSRYKNQNNKLLSQCKGKTKDDILLENKKIIENLKL